MIVYMREKKRLLLLSLLGWTGRTVSREAFVEQTRSGGGIIRTMLG